MHPTQWNIRGHPGVLGGFPKANGWRSILRAVATETFDCFLVLSLSSSLILAATDHRYRSTCKPLYTAIRSCGSPITAQLVFVQWWVYIFSLPQKLNISWSALGYSLEARQIQDVNSLYLSKPPSLRDDTCSDVNSVANQSGKWKGEITLIRYGTRSQCVIGTDSALLQIDFLLMLNHACYVLSIQVSLCFN